ncbi:hypothetical protein Tco_1237023 [Tanacetum coccineum]
MLCYLTGMEPYYIQCIKDGPFKLRTTEGDDKLESQLTQEERRVINLDQRLKSIIISCLPDDIIESVISCETAKDTWNDLVYSFEGPSDTKENNGLASLKDLEIPTILRPLNLLTFMEGLSMKTTLSQKDFQENSDDEVDERTSK